MTDTILNIKNLHIHFNVNNGSAKVLNGIDLSVKQGHLLGLVGESGSGKSVLAMSMLAYVREPGIIKKGEIFFDKKDILALTEEELQKKYRGKEIGLIAANARAHLNPLLPVGEQIANVYSAHTKKPKKEGRIKAVEILKSVGINDAERRAESYPHELSGGMAQRVMIAITLVNAPRFIVADDCTNGLDVTVAAQVMDLLLLILKERESSGIFITHDLGIVAQCCDEVAIMYSGQIFEQAPVKDFFNKPLHPYSDVLLDSLPERRKAKPEIDTIGNLPNPLQLPNGCLFHPRCPRAQELCLREKPKIRVISPGHTVKCHYPLEN